ncbi:DMT family transporter [Solidesulfovibrio sp.]|uniref:DMT family transporter n=1 Tax=Solidesulfovibrio sp. TaxID=2910990 RepID=UPI002B206F28|nr:DMT family transporter [Solidesulfovibrio sp.]MEA4857223.1 DMT family transporter [Solidesulfovibrio sp.]
MPDQRKATRYGLATVAMWSTVATAFKLSLAHLTPLQLLLYASLASCLVLGLVLAATGRLGALFALSRPQWRRSMLLGALNPFLYYTILFAAYDLLPAQEAQPLNYTWAITLSLLAVPLLGQKLRRRDLLALVVSYAGVVVIASHGDVLGLRFASPFGGALALVSTLVWALYWILGAKDDRDPVVGLLANFLCSLPLTLLAVLCFSDPWPGSWAGLAGAAYVGVFEMGLAFVTWLTALRCAVNAARVANLIFLSPFLSLVLIHFLVGEAILPSTVVGLVLILAGLGAQRAGR